MKPIESEENVTSTIKISLEEAKRWYEGVDEEEACDILGELAQRAFHENYLRGYSYSSIESEISTCFNTRKELIYLPYFDKKDQLLNRIMLKLKKISLYFNESWSKSQTGVGYCIYFHNGDAKVVEHARTLMPGVSYFKDIDDAFKAIELLEEDIKEFKELCGL